MRTDVPDLLELLDETNLLDDGVGVPLKQLDRAVGLLLEQADDRT
jgi:hypothetical protein